MCDQSIACNPHWHIRSMKTIIKRAVHQVTPDLIQHTQYCNGSTMRNVTLKHTPSYNRAQLTARSSSSRCVSAAEHHTAEQYYKTGGANSENLSQEAINHGTLARTSSRYKFFEKLLWKPSEDPSQMSSWNQMSLPI